VREGKHLPAKEYVEWLQLNAPYLGNQQLKIMGGEPTIHPEFAYMAIESLKYYGTISLFTNGTTLNSVIRNVPILKAHTHGRFQFIINGFTAPDFDTDYFERVDLHFVIPFDERSLAQIISKILKFAPDRKFNFILSGDTGVNVLDSRIANVYRERYLEFFKQVIPAIAPRYSFDHPFPECFWTQDLIDELHQLGVGPVHLHPACCDVRIGLIDTEWNLHYCNQTRIELFNIKGLEIPKVNEMIQSAPGMKVDLVKSISEKCRNCPAVVTCKTKCWCRQLQK
jgi:sulfatase maturation enzyme AslB (radical SAM superfamily)